MNRQEEYRALLEELGREPARLEDSPQRAVRRFKRRRSRRAFGWAGSLAGVCAAFVLMVNASPAFAVSCGSVPVLKEIAAAVAFSPSLKSAIEHDFIQYLGQSQTVDGITVTLESIIADEQQMVVFYSADGIDTWHTASCDLSDSRGSGLSNYAVTSGAAQERLNTFEIHFNGTQLPHQLILNINLRIHREEGEPETTPTFTFPVSLDPHKTAPAIRLDVNEWIELDGQRLLIEALELTPTKTALYLNDDESNSAWLTGLDFYFTDKKGQRYDQTDSSVSAMGREGSTGFYTYYHQSLYFLDSLDELTLHITGAWWQDKDEHTMRVDLTDESADRLPESILALSVTEENYVEMGKQTTLWVTTVSPRGPLGNTYTDPEGKEHSFSGFGMQNAHFDDNGVWKPDRYSYILEDYPFDWVTVQLDYTHVSIPEIPLTVSIQ